VSSGAREGAREQLDEKTVRASSLMRAGSCSNSSSLSSHFGGGEIKFVGKEEEMCAIGDNIRGEGGGDDFLRYFRGNVSVAMDGTG
jgi:hypothetical protein